MSFFLEINQLASLRCSVYIDGIPCPPKVSPTKTKGKKDSSKPTSKKTKPKGKR